MYTHADLYLYISVYPYIYLYSYMSCTNLKALTLSELTAKPRHRP